MKVLIASIAASGIVRVRAELIGELINRGYEVAAVVPRSADYKKMEDIGCRGIDVKIQQYGKNPLSDYRVYRQYIKILKDERPDIVLLFTTKPNVYCGMACRKLNIPAIMNITGMGSALGSKSFTQKILISLYRIACGGKNMRRILFQNEDSRDFFKRNRIGKESVYKCIPGSGVNLEKFDLQPFPVSDTVDFLFIARIMKLKGIDEYIAAAEKVREKHPEAVFHVLGSSDDEHYKELLSEKNKSGTVVWHGRVDNIPDFEKMSQCTVQPSY